MTEKKKKALFIGLPILGIVLFVIAISMDGPAPDDSDLRSIYDPVPVETNAFDGFCVAGEMAYVDEDKIGECESKVWDQETARALVEAHARPLQLWETNMQLANLQVPEIDSFDALFPYLSRWRNLARLIAIKARLLAEDGRSQEALGLAVAIVDFGRRQQSANGCLITNLVGIAIQSIGLSTVRQICLDHEVPTDVLTGAIVQLEPLTSDRDGMQDAIRVEYTMGSKLLDDMAAGDKDLGSMALLSGKSKLVYKVPFFFKKNQSKARLADSYRAFVNNGKVNRRDRQHIEFKPPSITRFILSGNMVGEAMHSILVPALDRISTKLDRLDTELHATRLALAIKAYRNDHGGAWPDTLDALVPTYVDTLPNDPFGDGPLAYSAKKHIVYSVGEDGVDGGGMSMEEFVELREKNKSMWGFADPGYLLDSSLMPKKAPETTEPPAPTAGNNGNQETNPSVAPTQPQPEKQSISDGP